MEINGPFKVIFGSNIRVRQPNTDDDRGHVEERAFELPLN
jgi:hypothetical protein